MYKITLITDKKKWESYLDSFPGANFLQSYNWGNFQAEMGNNVWRIIVENRQKTVLASQFYFIKAKRGPYFACPGGPLFKAKDSLALEEFVKYIKVLGKNQKAWFFRCRPQILLQNENLAQFKKAGLVRAPMHMTADLTLQLDLNQDLDTILSSMRKNTRYSIRRALKSNLKLKISQNRQEVENLYRLQMATQHKQGFVPFSLPFLQKQFDSFVTDNNIQLFSVYEQSNLCAMAMVIFYRREAVYHYAGMNERGYKNNASYLIQWAAIQEAKQRGCTHYNFWGISPADARNHRFAGVSLFKRGFGGKEVYYLPAHDLPISNLYLLTKLFELFRKKIRRL